MGCFRGNFSSFLEFLFLFFEKVRARHCVHEKKCDILTAVDV